MRALILLALVSLAAALPAWASPRPFELRDGQAVITVTIKGKQLPALLDTGATRSLIEVDLARELGILTRKIRSSGTFGVGAAEGRIAFGQTERRIAVDFGAGPMWRYLGTYEADHAFGPDGVRLLIGMDFLYSLAVSLDFQRMTIDFQPSADFTPPQGEPLKLTEAGWLRSTLAVSLGGAQAELLLDTAASSAMHLDSAFVAKTPALKALPVSSRRIAGIDGVSDHDAIVVPHVAFGGTAFENVRASSGSFAKLERGSTDMDGVVGVDLLKRFNLVIDFGRYRIWMTPHATAPPDE